MKLTIKNNTPKEEKINLEFCERCDEKVNKGLAYNDTFYCWSCIGYLEVKAESLSDN